MHRKAEPQVGIGKTCDNPKKTELLRMELPKKKNKSMVQISLKSVLEEQTWLSDNWSAKMRNNFPSLHFEPAPPARATQY